MPDDRSEDRTANAHDELVQLRTEFEQAATPLQKLMSRVRRYLSTPGVTVIAIAAVATWIVVNLTLGRRAFDSSPFAILNTIVSAGAFIATFLILSGQRREEDAAKRISRLTLHLAAESEQKIAKLIQLVEEQRRDSAHMPNRHDPEAEEMSSAAGPRALVERLETEETI